MKWFSTFLLFRFRCSGIISVFELWLKYLHKIAFLMFAFASLLTLFNLICFLLIPPPPFNNKNFINHFFIITSRARNTKWDLFHVHDVERSSIHRISSLHLGSHRSNHAFQIILLKSFARPSLSRHLLSI